MSFKRRIVRRQVSAVATETTAALPSPASPAPSASSLVWEVALPKSTRYAPIHADRGRVATRRMLNKASGHR